MSTELHQPLKAAPERPTASEKARIAAIAWKKAHKGVTQEHVCTLPLLQGSPPTSLHGTLFRNGPGRMHAFGTRYEHLFDGDGHIQSFTFNGSTVEYKNKYVRTKEFVAEDKAQKLLYRSTGTPKPGGVLKNAFIPVFKNAANTNAFVHHDRLYALWEGGAAHRIDPKTLDTVSRENFDEQLLDELTWWTRGAGRELPFSAHPRIDPETGEMFNFGLANGPKQRLFLYRINKQAKVVKKQAIALDALYFVHDFSLTKDYQILFLCPARFDMLRTMLGICTPLSSLRYDSARPTRVMVVPREGSAEPTVLDAPGCFIFHHATVTQESATKIHCRVVRSAGYPELPHPDDIEKNTLAGDRSGMGFLTEFTLDLARKTVEQKRLFDTPCELPSVLRAQTQERDSVVWAVAGAEPYTAGVYTTITRFEGRDEKKTVRDFYPHIPGEAVPVTDDQGKVHLMVVVFDGEREKSVLHLLDPDSLETTAAWELPHGVPPGFHGTWMPTAVSAK